MNRMIQAYLGNNCSTSKSLKQKISMLWVPSNNCLAICWEWSAEVEQTTKEKTSFCRSVVPSITPVPYASKRWKSLPQNLSNSSSIAAKKYKMPNSHKPWRWSAVFKLIEAREFQVFRNPTNSSQFSKWWRQNEKLPRSKNKPSKRSKIKYGACLVKSWI